MNSIFFSRRRVRRSAHPWFGAIAVTRAVSIVAFFLFAFAAWVCAQRSADAGAEFKRISSELADGFAAPFWRMLGVPAFRCIPCRHKFFSMLPLSKNVEDSEYKIDKIAS